MQQLPISEEGFHVVTARGKTGVDSVGGSGLPLFHLKTYIFIDVSPLEGNREAS